MIARLKGIVWETGPGCVVIDVGGVGYEVKAPEPVLAQIGGPANPADLYIRQVFREDDASLYGFVTEGQRDLFDMLRDVKGCGARISLAILSTLGVESALAAIASQDAKMVARTKGVGPKLAERIIVELKEKAQELALGVKVTPGGSDSKASKEGPDELTQALMALGYRRGEIEAIADQAKTEGEEVQDQVLAALKLLA
jgi:Holliday junction DNA helicase RuvA